MISYLRKVVIEITHRVDLNLRFSWNRYPSNIADMLRGMFHSLTNYVRQYVKARHHSTEQS